jgi:hypothetical protein
VDALVDSGAAELALPSNLITMSMDFLGTAVE